MKPKRESRKRGLTWDPIVVERLARLKLLDFMPEETVRVCLQESVPSPALDPDTVRKLDTLLSMYSERRLTPSTLRNDLEQAIGALGKKHGAIQINPIAESIRYVQSRVGLPLWPNLIEGPDPDDDERRREYLQNQSQRHVFLQSMGLDDGTWDEVVWQESMLLRFDPRGKSPLDWMEPAVRLRLDAEAADFRDGEFDLVRAHELLRSIPEWRLYGPVTTTLAIEYFRAQVNGDQSFVEILKLPIDESPIFDMIADAKLGCTGEFPPLQIRCSREQFRRFLSPLTNETSRLQGQILYYLIRLEAWFSDTHDSTIPKDLAELWPQPLSPFHVRPTPEFRLIKTKFMEELKIEGKVFTDIWAGYTTLQVRELRRRRAPASETVFWAARILESVRPDVYNAYRIPIDRFHSVMHDTEGLLRRDGAWLSATAGLFLADLSIDPLMHVVFHTEVLNGRDRLAYKPGRGGTDDHMLNLVLVHAYTLLKNRWKSRKLRRVDEVLSEIKELPTWIRDSVDPVYFTTDNATDAGATSLFAYLTPFVLSMFGSNEWKLQPHKAKARCMDHQSSPDLDVLLNDLPHQFSAAVSGRPNP
jgi:hypothetical protein